MKTYENELPIILCFNNFNYAVLLFLQCNQIKPRFSHLIPINNCMYILVRGSQSRGQPPLSHAEQVPDELFCFHENIHLDLFEKNLYEKKLFTFICMSSP